MTTELVQRATRNPVQVYLARLDAESSQRVMLSGLRRVLKALGSSVDPEAFPWAKMRYAEVVAARSALQKCGAGPSAVNLSLCALRGVLREAYRLGLLTGEEWTRVHDVSGVKAELLPAGRHLPAQELAQLFRACERNAMGIRDAALLGILRTTGMRRAELCALELASVVDRRQGELIILGKRNKERTGYLGAATPLVERWITEVRGEAPGPLLWSQDANGRWRQCLSTSGVYAILRRLAKKAGTPTLSPHDFRRTFVSDLLDAGVDLVTVQKLAGHDDPKTTARYDRRKESAKKTAIGLLTLPGFSE